MGGRHHNMAEQNQYLTSSMASNMAISSQIIETREESMTQLEDITR